MTWWLVYDPAMSNGSQVIFSHTALGLAVIGSALALGLGGELSGGTAIAVIAGAGGLGGVGALTAGSGSKSGV